MTKLRELIIEEIRNQLNEANSKKFGVFVYDRNTDANIESDNYKFEKDALKAAKVMVRKYSKNKYYVEVWKSDDNGSFGNTGAAIWDNF